MVSNLKAGHAKKCIDFKEQAFRAKGQEDLYVLKNFPSIKLEIQPSVANAFRILKHFGDQYIGKPDFIPPHVHGLSNNIITGAWSYDTFMGRKWEIEHAFHDDVCEVLDNDKEYLVCKYHKTCKTYGDIIKFLTPGLIWALKVYRQLPKRASKYFLVPVTASAEVISIPSNLKSYNKHFLKDTNGKVSEVSPTSNQNRKLFHRELMKLTKNEDALKDLMTQLDAHGRKVQDKHYLVKDPEDDLAIAKVLVEKILGDTVPPPSDSAEGNTLEQELADILEGYVPDEQADNQLVEGHDPDEEPLDHWDLGELFGIAPPGQLDILPLMDINIELPPVEAKVQKEKKEKEKKKEKKEKKRKKKDQKHTTVKEESKESKDEVMRKELYAKYEYIKSDAGRKASIPPTIHHQIWDLCKAWQQNNGKGELDRPMTGEWYWDLRCQLIQEGRLTVYHSWDACRNNVRDTIKRMNNEKAKNEKIGS